MTAGKRNSKRVDRKEAERQVPKPATQQGSVLTLAFLIGSQLLTLVNPLQLVQMLVQMVGLAVVGIRTGGDLPQLDSYKQQATFHLPVHGTWYVANGGVDRDTSHSWDVLNQRYAYDLIMIDDEMYSHKGDGKVKNDYYCYEQSIVAPAPGEVVQINDGVRDAMYPGRMILDFLARDFRGNFVIIKHSEREYSFLGHFVPKSIAVKVGDIVEQGQFLGKCGNSGHSTEPHLHFHVQDRPSFFFSAGLPVKFSNVAVDGTHHKQAYLAKGQRIMRDVQERRD